MATRRAALARYLTPPSLPIFVLSLVLAVMAVASFYTHVPFIGRYVDGHRFAFMTAAYVVLALGVLFTRI